MSKYLLFQMPDGEIKIETDQGAIGKKRIESCLAEGAKIAGTVAKVRASNTKRNGNS